MVVIMSALEVVLLFSSMIATAFACNGYEIKNLTAVICENKGQLLDLGDFSVMLDADCNIVPKGCFTILKQINSGNGTYLVEKKAKMGMPLKFSGQKDMCEVLKKSKESPEITLALEVLKLEQECPVMPKKVCPNGAVSVKNYKGQMKMVEGEWTGTVKGISDVGELCMKVTAMVSSGGGRGASSFPTMG